MAVDGGEQRRRPGAGIAARVDRLPDARPVEVLTSFAELPTTAGGRDVAAVLRARDAAAHRRSRKPSGARFVLAARR
jgi:hypothetical protein